MNNRKHIIIKSNFDDADNELEKYQKEGYILHGSIISNGDSVLITLRKEEIKEVKEAKESDVGSYSGYKKKKVSDNKSIFS